MTTLRAAIYLRISNDPEGLELGTTRQREDCRAHADRRGYTIYRIYTDNDRSASRYARKVRPEYRQMIADAAAGRFDVILAYSSSRITRQPRENEDLIDLALNHGTRYDYIRSPSFDLNTADGREMARNAAARDAGEVERTSERVLRDVDQRAKDGRFHGGAPPFGIEAVWSVIDRRERIDSFKLHSIHAKWLKEAARRVIANETVYGIVVDWNKQGRQTPTSKRWTTRTLRRILVNPATIGKRERNGELFTAPWPAILTDKQHAQLVAILGDPERKTSPTNERRYMLTGLLFCGNLTASGEVCGNYLTSTSLKKNAPAAFECSSTKTGHPNACGKIKVVMAPVEAFVTEALFAALDTPTFHTAVAAASTTDGREAELREAMADADKVLISLENEKDDGLIDDPSYRRRRARITKRRDDLRKEYLTLTRSARLAALPTGDELQRVWSDRDNTWRRTIVSEVIERVDVGPHPRGVSSAPPRRRGEGETAWRERFDAARQTTMEQRLHIKWLA
jgi:site-specific DNA recombinase